MRFNSSNGLTYDFEFFIVDSAFYEYSINKPIVPFGTLMLKIMEYNENEGRGFAVPFNVLTTQGTYNLPKDFVDYVYRIHKNMAFV